jgi:hypothetical protein
MFEDNPRDILLGDPLSEITRKERRNLLVTSVVGIAIAKADLVPSKITAIGVEFSQTNQKALMVVIGCILLYFFLAFIFYAWSDSLLWLRKHTKAQEKILRDEINSAKKMDEEKRQYLECTGRSKEEIFKLHEEYLIIMTQRNKELGKALNQTVAKNFQAYFWRPATIFRALFDFILPVIVGGYACWVVFTWTATVVN